MGFLLVFFFLMDTIKELWMSIHIDTGSWVLKIAPDYYSGTVEETFMFTSVKFEFSCPELLFCVRKKTEFLSANHWLSWLRDMKFLKREKGTNFAVCWELCIRISFTEPPLPNTDMPHVQKNLKKNWISTVHCRAALANVGWLAGFRLCAAVLPAPAGEF